MAASLRSRVEVVQLEEFHSWCIDYLQSAMHTFIQFKLLFGVTVSDTAKRSTAIREVELLGVPGYKKCSNFYRKLVLLITQSSSLSNIKSGLNFIAH